jgi:hypothetical protein
MQLHLEFNIEPESNSGVSLRGRCEIQVLDNPDAKMALDTRGTTGGALSRWEAEPGPLMLQGDRGKVRFRSIEVRTR